MSEATRAAWRRAFNNLELPLDRPERFDDWHVARDLQEVDKLIETFRMSDECVRALYTGHNRSRKSTELFRVMRQLDGDFTPVYFSADDALDRMDLSHLDVLLGMCEALLARATQIGVELDPTVGESLNAWAAELHDDVEQISAESHTDVLQATAGVRAYIFDLFARLRTEGQTRREIRRRLEPEGGQILEVLELIAAGFQNSDVPKPLLIVDDLEKCDLDTAEGLFINHAPELSEAPCDVIYTVPITLRASHRFAVVRGRYGDDFLLPMISVHDREGSPASDREVIATIISRRIEQGLLPKEVIDSIVLNSGGIIGDALRMARNVCRTASMQQAEAATPSMAENEFRELVKAFAMSLDEDDYGRLREVATARHSPIDEDHRRLMHALAILRYEDDPYWYDVHPAVRRLLEARGLV
ncbi:MAG: hypothetical protein U9R79_04545 [Armatimonadota bacterium]|nr:hypothetical protein [Armatimonadota bacterium]